LFGGESEEEINISGTTLTITWDVDGLVFNTWVDVEIDNWEEDLTWLEELNLEIEKILGTDEGSEMITWFITWEVLEEEFLEEDSLTWIVEEWEGFTWVNGKEVELDIEDGIEEVTWDIVTWNIVTWVDIEVVQPQPVWLTDLDDQQVRDVFWNLVE
jgi:hypothetical protein